MEGKKATVIFILGGPGSGKGTQSQKIQKDFKFVHLSAGDLLRAERKQPGSQFGQIIEKNIVEGKIVPSEITVSLLSRAISKSGLEGGRFLIDGFPRNIENLSTWQKQMNSKVEIPFIVHLTCSQQVMLERLLKRGQSSGRSDDNIDSIKKRFVTYEQQTKETVKYYDELNKCCHLNAEREVDDIFKELTQVFKKYKLT